MKANLLAFLGFFPVLTSGCSGSDAPSSPAGDAGAPGTTGSGTVTGTVMGTAFTTIASAWWIGKPGAGSAPTQIYLSDATLSCADLATAGWDHLLGTNQLLEFDLAGDAAKKYVIKVDLDASYVKEPHNPSADSGSVTITETNAAKNIVGSYDLTFPRGTGLDAGSDNVKGTFDAAYCADGVEP